MKTNILKSKKDRRKLKIRGKIFGTAEKPRLTVFRSNKFIYAQLIDDAKRVTLVDVRGTNNVTNALQTGKELAKKALAKKITTVVFDRSGYRYHGRVKSLADGAREGGLVL